MIEFTNPAFKDTGCLPKVDDPEKEIEILRGCIRDLDNLLTKTIIDKNAALKRLQERDEELTTLKCKLNNYLKALESKGLA